MATLTGSWLAFRLGVDSARIDRMRKAGELCGVRSDSGEWLYPSGQFDAEGKTKPAVEKPRGRFKGSPTSVLVMDSSGRQQT
jgi:hypothetical protein